jgi:hypothetical protein
MVENHRGSLDERLLGFDARKMWLDPSIHWDRERRDRFLLRMDASPVLSTDELVWPSVFNTHHLPLATESELEELGLVGPQRPSWIGPNAPLWEDLYRLKAQLFAVDLEIRRPYWIIAITAHLFPEIASQLTYGPYFEKTNPDRRRQSWTFLGYDVSDGSLLSGLTNCGYTQDDRQKQPASLLVKELNPYHLFDSIEPAEAFRKYSDERVKEHAPFLVYGLYLVEEMAVR